MKNTKGTAFFAGIILLLGIIYYVTKNKNVSMMSEFEPSAVVASNLPAASSSETQFASANGIQTTMPNNIPSPPMANPSDYLPSDTNSHCASLNPIGDGALSGVNLLSAGSIIGINTQGSSMRNSNLQLRCEPTIEKKNIGPWLNSTIDPPLSRKSLDGGDCGL